MTLKKVLSPIVFVLALCISFVWSTHVVLAQEHHTLELDLERYQEVVSQLSSLDNHQLQVWKLDDSYSYEDREQIVQDFHNLDESQLSSFEKMAFDMFFLADRIQVPQIPNGLYYVRTVIETGKVSYPSEFLFEMTDQTVEPLVILAKKTDQITSQVRLIKVDQDQNRLAGVGFRLVTLSADGSEQSVPLIGGYRYSQSGQVNQLLYTDDKGEISVTNLPLGNYRFVEVEALAGYSMPHVNTDFQVFDRNEVKLIVVNPKLPKGNVSFMKVDGKTNHSLQGAIFKVMKKEVDRYVPVLQNGKELVLTSGQDGRFRAEGLDYGTYSLWEIQTPTGYVQLTKPVSFTVNREEVNETITVIKNNKRPSFDVPDTGEETLYILMIMAAILFVGGYHLVRKSNNT